MTGLLEKLDDELGPEASRLTVAVLKRLRWPLPAKGEFFPSADSGPAVFSNMHALVLRVRAIRKILPADPHVLQPLISFSNEAAAVEIFPGVRFQSSYVSDMSNPGRDALLPQLFQDEAYLRQQLERTGLDYSDAGINNTALLPVYSEAFPAGYPVVGDFGAVEQRSAAVWQARREQRAWQERCGVIQPQPPDSRLETMSAPDQSMLFLPIRRALRDVFAAAGRGEHHQALSALNDVCQSAKEKGFLSVSWRHHSVAYNSKLDDISCRYERRMRGYNAS
ncbi:MAG: hypothetical protein HYS17_10910 [Micavibrio aeruginosavorus]|uniref:Uncharacterized protein n=1 Tax=Micavibrio aeruginosavorus TaxID=349221 RepID=A0A7T5R219_9BACT|nr:MAG: hypothetical protein HYS17_10910 [Micavibrio aeruginosavorus]